MSDLIERQAAIDVLNVGAELLKRVLDDAYVVGAEREKYEWGLGLIESYISDMRELPSAQPEQSIAEWQKDFREYMNMLNIPRDDYNGIMEYINEVPSAQPEIKCIAKVTLTDEQVKEAFEKAKDAILTVLPERKKGHWEDVPHKSVEHGEVVVDGKTVRCSVCKRAEKGWNKGMNYCPNCGAKMEVEHEA